jgi:hypothetical protein
MKILAPQKLARLALATFLAVGATGAAVATTAPQAALAVPVGFHGGFRGGFHSFPRFVRRGGSWVRFGFYDAPRPGFYPAVGYVGYAPPVYPAYAYGPGYYPAYYPAPYYGPAVSLDFSFGGGRFFNRGFNRGFAGGRGFVGGHGFAGGHGFVAGHGFAAGGGFHR